MNYPAHRSICNYYKHHNSWNELERAGTIVLVFQSTKQCMLIARINNFTLFGATPFATKWYLCMAITHRQMDVQAFDTFAMAAGVNVSMSTYGCTLATTASGMLSQFKNQITHLLRRAFLLIVQTATILIFIHRWLYIGRHKNENVRHAAAHEFYFTQPFPSHSLRALPFSFQPAGFTEQNKHKCH